MSVAGQVHKDFNKPVLFPFSKLDIENSEHLVG